MYTVCDFVSSSLSFMIEKLLVIGFAFLAKLRRFCMNFTRILVWKQWKHKGCEWLHTSSLAAVHITSYLMSSNVCPCIVIDACYMPTVPGIGHCPALKRLAQSKDVLWDHTLSIQNFINTFPRIQSLLLPVVKNKPNHSDPALSSVDALPKCALTRMSPKTRHSIPADGLRAGLAFVSVKTWTGFILASQHLPSASYEAERKLYPLIVSDCYKLFPWNLLPDSWGLGTFLAAFCTWLHPSVGLKCVLWGWMKHFIHRKIFIKFHMPVRCRANTIVYTSSEFYPWSISVIIMKCPLYCC